MRSVARANSSRFCLITFTPIEAIIFVGVFLFFINVVLADDVSGEVIHVFDGDTIEVQLRQQVRRVRLVGIDAPERHQAFSHASRQSLIDLILHRRINILGRGEDRYHRSLAIVLLEGKNINAEQVRRGMAWVYPAYRNDAELLELERTARIHRLGLWSESRPIPPWDYRRMQMMFVEPTRCKLSINCHHDDTPAAQ